MCCHGNSFKDIKNPFTGLHLPCIYIIQMKFEANRVKIKGWFQSILKMTHFLLPVGGVITLTHNSHIHVIVLLQQAHCWSFIEIGWCMLKLWHTSCFTFLAIISFPRHGQTVWDIKNPLANFHPQCLDFTLTEFRRIWIRALGGVFKIPLQVFYEQP